jgi:Mce-associated membrane protein
MTKAAADSPSEQKPAPGKNRGLPRMLAMAAAALLVVALVCGATLSVLAMRSAHERDERRAEYVETARQAIVNLTTIRADSAKQDIDRILSLASGEFKTEFDGRVDPFTSIVQQAKVVSSGEIVEAALESDDDRSGRVLVAAKQTLTNAGQAEPQTRYYRFRVTVSRGDSGLTVSNVEFVA